MFIITVDLEKCEGCGDCVETCPVELIKLVEEDGKKHAEYSGDPSDCIGCMSCETCKDSAITITEI